MKLFPQKRKSKVITEAYSSDSSSQNHCEELNIHLSNIDKNTSTKIVPVPTSLMTHFLDESFPNSAHIHLLLS